MLITCAFLFLLCFQNRSAERCCKTIKNTELVMAFLVHRHGDRSPEKGQLFLSSDPELLAKMTTPYGFGQLTDVGKARSYALGRFLRRRYDQFLSSSFNSSDIFVQATDYNRTQMTAKIAITAAYSSKGMWSEDMELVPLEMAVVSPDVDHNLAFVNCPQLELYFFKVGSETKSPKELEIYDEVRDLLSKDRGFNMTNTALTMFAMHNILTSQQSVGMPLSNFDRRLFPTIQQSNIMAVDHIFGNQTYVPLQAGVLLKEFFDTADQIISGADIPRLRVLSAHDFNVYSFTAAARAVPRQGAPLYCSVFSLELRRCKYNGKYVVVPVYVKSPDESEAYLEIEDCGVICDYEKFRDLTSQNVLTSLQYQERCKSEGPIVLSPEVEKLVQDFLM